MSYQASHFSKINVDEATPGNIYQRITASRVYYAFDDSKTYARSRKVNFRAESNESEKTVVEVFQKDGWTVTNEVQVFHPIFFFMSCVPDGLCEKNGRRFLLEVKAIFLDESLIYNEMGELYDENSDKQKWIRQVQISLHISGLSEGFLVIFDYEKQSVKEEILVKREENFLRDNFERFREFFIDIIFFDNSCLRRTKSSIRSLVRKRIVGFFNEQIVLNRVKFENRKNSDLDKHLIDEFTRFLNQELDKKAIQVKESETNSVLFEQDPVLSGASEKNEDDLENVEEDN